MTAKHKPATALPWGALPYKSGDREREQIAQDDVYELHAANAYPKLVEAIKDSLHGHCDVGSQSSALFLRVLRELGEDR